MQFTEQRMPPKRREILTRAVSSISVLILLGLALHLLFPQIAQLEHSIQVIKSLRLWGVGLALCAQILSYVGSGILFQAVVALTYIQISLTRSILISLEIGRAHV